MKTAKWWLAGASLGLLAGCASPSGNAPLTATLTTPMSAPYSSDTTGVQAEEVGTPRGAYLPAIEIDFSQLPQSAQKTIHEEAGNVFIDRIIRETRGGQTVYKVELKPDNGQIFHGVLVVASDGTLLKAAHIGEAAGAQLPSGAGH